MSKSDDAKLREQRLAAKLRENLKRRKGQLKARADSQSRAPEARADIPPNDNEETGSE